LYEAQQPRRLSMSSMMPMLRTSTVPVNTRVLLMTQAMVPAMAAPLIKVRREMTMRERAATG
jgi:hypothetical protein